MPDCEQIRIAATAIADGDPPVIEPQAVDAHITDCPACRDAIEKLDLPTLLPADLQRSTVTSTVWDGVRQRVEGQSVAATESRRARRRLHVVLVAMVACLLIGVSVPLWMPRADRDDPRSGPSPTDSLIVLAPVDQSGSNMRIMPFAYEAEADVVAVAVMGKPRSLGTQQVIGMDLVEVLKGRQQLGSLESADGFVPFGCAVPPERSRFSDMYRPGERVAVCLQQNGDAWSTLQMTHLTDHTEPEWRDRVPPFLDVLLASESDAPERRYRELLTEQALPGDLHDVPTTPDQWLSEPAFYGLEYNPDPRAAAPLREMLIASLSSSSTVSMPLNAQTVDSQQPGLNQPPGVKSLTQKRQQRSLQPEVSATAAQTARIPDSAYDLISLLSRMRDAESVLPVMNYILRSSDVGQRQLLPLLPGLCSDAGRGTLLAVRHALQMLEERYEGNRNNGYLETLADTQAAIDQLLAE